MMQDILSIKLMMVIEALELFAEESIENALYHVSLVNGEYFDWQHNNEVGNNEDGYAGVFGMLIDRVQIVIE